MMATCWLLNKVDVNMLLKAHFQPNLGCETQKMMGQTIYSRRTSLSTEWFGHFSPHSRLTTSLVLEAPVTFGVVA